ncbi:adenylate/guanylate cyclase domain-containing protein [Thioflexithrix psekupsensis]|uniref:Adenylate/guanylate cyclase domain-containing protein n=1 Tax=Thioflexithrix psekupsensis TaxID=1570016 RepID=A0A251X9T4_9GAMM|nr:adenylate/guanylate cyclase domain-containing protein [Thioflexithrix psekupsensis]
MRRYLMRWFLGSSIIVFFMLHVMSPPSSLFSWQFIHNLERDLYDLRLNVAAASVVDDRVIIVDIDEKSLAEIGRWPWNRQILSQLVDRLFIDYEIDLLGLDIAFPEADNSSGWSQLEVLANTLLKDQDGFLAQLPEIKKQLDYDQQFADSLHHRRVVLGFSFATLESRMENVQAGLLPEPLLTAEEVRLLPLKYESANGYIANLPLLQANALGAGHFNVSPDVDGVVRRVPMLQAYQGDLYESLSLAMARVILGEPTIELGLEKGSGGYHRLEFLQLGARKIPVDAYLRTLIPFRGPQGSFPYLSASDVLKQRVSDPQLLKDKIVLLGTTAQGLLDLRTTPVATVYPGVEIHANLLAGILDHQLMDQPAYIVGMEWIILVLSGVLLLFLLSLLSPLWATVNTVLLVTGIVWFNVMVWEQLNLVLPLAATLLMILSLFLFSMSYGYFIESSHKRAMAHLFGQYVPPELVDEMSRDPSSFNMRGENRDMTVLFSDVRGFTTISEGLEPQELSELMNEFLTPMTRIIHEQRGTIDKYMGDAIMAFWGAPLRDEKHARHALDAAMGMVQTLEAMQPQFKARGWPEIKVGVGLNSGPMNVGNMGSQFRIAYTVMGDAVNLGSRLEGLTKQYGVQIIASETTVAAVPEYAFRELDRVRVKGKDLPVVIYEPLGARDHLTESVISELVLYETALTHYREQHWELARQLLLQLREQSPERLLYSIYLERIDYFSHNPPGEDWDGVYTFTTK